MNVLRVGVTGGVDLRWRTPEDGGTAIGQCKHYARSTFAHLLAAATAEVDHVEALRPDSYSFITSYDLTVGQKSKIYELFRDWMSGPDDVLGGRDVDGLITRQATVERRHPKLWLSSGSQLFWATHSDLANRASALRDRIKRSLPRYVVNKGYWDARSLLERNRVCIVAGLPGIGKTMLAQVLLSDAMAQGYEPFEVSRDIEEAWTVLHGEDLQVFLYDDFLGQVTFAERLAKNEDRRLSDFISKIASMKTKQLILTTREYILQDARRTYELLRSLDDRMHFVLELEDYTRGDRSRILYNHLWHADLSPIALAEIASGGYKRIVDHPGYSPRLIEYCTSPKFDTHESGYVSRFVNDLDHPEHLWRTAFETHLTPDQQLLAVVLATLPPTVEHDDLREAHRSLCDRQSVPCSGAMFRAALEVMEGSFVAIERFQSRPIVRFHNPSVLEFTLDWLADDSDLVAAVLQSAVFFEQVVHLQGYARGSNPSHERDAGRPSLLSQLELRSQDVAAAVSRLILSPSPERRNEWVRSAGQEYQRPSSWFEDRLGAVLLLPTGCCPADNWTVSQVRTLAERWRNEEGDKAEAVSLIRRLEAASRSEPDAIPEEALTEARSALDAWLPADLDETEEDWLPYLDRLESDHGVRLDADAELAERFASFAREELWRWSPSPPNLEDLVDYALRFELHDLVEELEEKVAEDRARDEEASVDSTGPTPTPAVGRSQRSEDEILDQLFRRLVIPDSAVGGERPS